MRQLTNKGLFILTIAMIIIVALQYLNWTTEQSYQKDAAFDRGQIKKFVTDLLNLARTATANSNEVQGVVIHNQAVIVYNQGIIVKVVSNIDNITKAKEYAQQIRQDYQDINTTDNDN